MNLKEYFAVTGSDVIYLHAAYYLRYRNSIQLPALGSYINAHTNVIDSQL